MERVQSAAQFRFKHSNNAGGVTEDLLTMMCQCQHNSYWSELPGGKATYCFGCHQTFPSVGQGALESGSMVIDRPVEPFVLPSPSRPLRTTDWLERWPAVKSDMAKKYHWYVAEINGYEYLVMPITREGTAIFYSARSLDTRAPKKYHYPAGIKRNYWLSDDQLARQPIFLCEGVADAVALSSYGSSVGLLGGSYDGSLNSLLKSKKVIVAFDGDFSGYCMAVEVAAKIARICSVGIRIVAGVDPTIWSIADAEEAMK
jgi:hypothetical protein